MCERWELYNLDQTLWLKETVGASIFLWFENCKQVLLFLQLKGLKHIRPYFVKPKKDKWSNDLAWHRVPRQTGINQLSVSGSVMKSVKKKHILWSCLWCRSSGITQEMINETRASTERRMLGDIQELLRQGEEVNQQDSQGATLVRPANKTTLKWGQLKGCTLTVIVCFVWFHNLPLITVNYQIINHLHLLTWPKTELSWPKVIVMHQKSTRAGRK